MSEQKANAALMKRLDNFEEFLPKFLPVVQRTWSNTIALNLPRFQQMALHVIQREPKIMECEALSILGSFATCAEYGLYPDDLRGLVYLVPRWDKDIGMMRCNFMLGYKGYVTLFRRNPMAASGKSVESERVYEGDQIQIEKGLNPILRHVPNLETKQKDRKLWLVYSILHYRDGDPDFDHVYGWQIEEIRQNHSDARDSKFSPWNSKSDLVRSWMEKKTSLKQVLKLSPALDDHIGAAVALDERSEVGIPQQLPASLDKETLELVNNMLTAREKAQGAVDLPASAGSGTKLDQLMAEKKAQKAESTEQGKKAPESAQPTEKKGETPVGQAPLPPMEGVPPAGPAEGEEEPLDRKAANNKERTALQAFVEANLEYLPEGTHVMVKLHDLRKQKAAIEAKKEVASAEKDTDRPFDDPQDPEPTETDSKTDVGTTLTGEAGGPAEASAPEPAKKEPDSTTSKAWSSFMNGD